MTGKRPRPPLNEETLRELALRHVGRFATSRAKLVDYLDRKLRERGWEGEAPPAPEALAERLAALGYVDDAAYAAMKASALSRRGYGARRVAETLRAAGIGEEEGARAKADAAAQAWDAADRFARRKRIGPFAAQAPDPKQREKWIAAFLRAGHGMDAARRWAEALPGEVPERDA